MGNHEGRYCYNWHRHTYICFRDCHNRHRYFHRRYFRDYYCHVRILIIVE